MRYKFIIVLLCIFIQFCDATYKPPKYAAMIAFYILDTYLPEQRAKEQCSQPNAIGYPYHDNNFNRIACLSNKVSKGLIYDADTKLPITVDTLPPGQSFLCQCPPAFNGGNWQRGNKTEDNPATGVSVSFIQYNPINSNIPLKYPDNYNSPDNLYCISQCSATDLNTTQYQFLKIR